jgi:hypothetical protein
MKIIVNIKFINIKKASEEEKAHFFHKQVIERPPMQLISILIDSEKTRLINYWH